MSASLHHHSGLWLNFIAALGSQFTAKCTTLQVCSSDSICNDLNPRQQFKPWNPGFMDDHPGGVDILRQHSGEDASRDFDDIGHSKQALKQMETFLVGSLKK